MRLYAVMLDPGHGGNDPGASGNGLIEKDINWKTAIECKSLLEARGIKCELSRTENECPTLQERAARAANAKANILISIHHNAGGGMGFEIYKSLKNTTDDHLAELLATEFKAIGQVPHGKGIYTRALEDGADYYGILRYSALRGIPAIISEFCYVDTKDYEKVMSDYLINQEAVTYAKAICKLCDVAWEIKDAVTSLLDAMTTKGVQFDRPYWESVLRGQQTAKPEYLTVLLGRLL